ncbi:hypothetical protein [Nonomuraea sp. GTA35]
MSRMPRISSSYVTGPRTAAGAHPAPISARVTTSAAIGHLACRTTSARR